MRSIENAATNNTEKTIPAIAAARGVLSFAWTSFSVGMAIVQSIWIN
jgi:hypothetical protein